MNRPLCGALLLMCTSYAGALEPLAPSPTFLEAEIERTSDPSRRWESSPTQFMAGMGGGLVGGGTGIFVGWVAGAVLGQAIYGDGNDGWFPDWFGMAVVGGMVGTGVGTVAGTSLAVKWTSSEAYPSRSLWPAAFGSLLGGIGGGLLLNAAPSLFENEFGTLTGIGTLVASSSLGAVLMDRSFARPAELTVAPWLPRPGLSGAVASLAF